MSGLDKNLDVGEATAAVRGPPEPVLAVVSDLDGTLLRSDGTLSPTTRAVLESLRRVGVPFVVATARTPRAIRRIVGHDGLGIVVCANGAVIWDAATDRVIAERCFEPAALAGALERLHFALPDAGLALLTAQRMFIDATYRRIRGSSADAEVVPDLAGVLGGSPIVAVAVRHPDLAAAQFMPCASLAFKGVGVMALASVPTLDIAPVGVNKATATAEVLHDLGCPAGATIVFGDMPNDLPLFEWAGWACAVSNAHPSVLEAADEIVPSNDDDGVSRAIRRMVKL